MTAIATVPVPSTPAPDAAGSGLGGISDGPLSWAEFTQGIRQFDRTGHCQHPVRLRGRTDAIDLATGELRSVYDSAIEPGGVLLTACGNRRETVCPPCSVIYKRDARQLVRAGLLGGKGVPESVVAHPCVFATFTAPSFGPVHSRRIKGRTVLPCHPRRDHKVRRCSHGRDISCPVRHGETDPRLGRALCSDCYDYEAAVLFNAYAGDLWRRFTTYLPRQLAHRLGVTQKRLRALARVRYVKVAEYQARGVVHFHAIIRLDAPGDDYQPPPPGIDVAVLADAIQRAATAVTLTLSQQEVHGSPLQLRFGNQVDIRPIRHGTVDGLPGTGEKLNVGAVGNYIAKYATKALDAPGVPDRPLRTAADLMTLRCPAHYRQMITAAWELGGGKTGPAPSRLCRWAHMLGYGGHFLTKSRRYSVTFGSLRRARTDHRKRQRYPHGEHDPWGRPLDETVVLVLNDWHFAGTGYLTTAGEELALASAARAREHQQACPHLELT